MAPIHSRKEKAPVPDDSFAAQMSYYEAEEQRRGETQRLHAHRVAEYKAEKIRFLRGEKPNVQDTLKAKVSGPVPRSMALRTEVQALLDVVSGFHITLP